MGETSGNVTNTDYKDQVVKQKEEYESLMKADSDMGKMLQEAEASVRVAKGQNETDPEKGEEKIKEYLANHNEGNEGNEYLVRGAELLCNCGSHKRKMNLQECHGVYIKGHPVVHELDCIQGDEENITWFGVCVNEDLTTENIKVVLNDGTPMTGKKCQPHIVGVWMDAYEGTKIVDNGDKIEEDNENPSGCKTLTVGSFLICKHGGIISPFDSGQDREVEVSEFEEGQEAYDRVMSFKCDEEMEGGCDDLLHAMLGAEGEGCVHGSGYEKDDSYADMYTESLVEFVKQHEGLSLTTYNGGQTVGYGFDFYLYPGVKVNFNEDGNSITEEEAERLLIIMLNQSCEQIKSYLEENNLKIDQNTFDALTDLFYNRNSNKLTKEIARAMAEKDDQKVLELLKDFDYRYALEYIYSGDSSKAQDYVDRNPGLAERRDEEYLIYKNGF